MMAGRIAKKLAETSPITEEDQLVLEGAVPAFRRCMVDHQFCGSSATCKGAAALSRSAPDAVGVSPELRREIESAWIQGAREPSSARALALQENPVQTGVERLLLALVDPAAAAYEVQDRGPGTSCQQRFSISDGDAGRAASLCFTDVELRAFERDLEEVVLGGGFEALHHAAVRSEQALSTRGEGSSPLSDEVRLLARKAEFAGGYLKAYFRNGKFWKIELSGEKWKEKLEAELRRRFPLYSDEDIQALLAHFELLSREWKFVFGGIGSDGFVTRGGAIHQFPAVEVKVDDLFGDAPSLPEVDFLQVGSDLVRVYMEAILDARLGVPAVSNATGASCELFGSEALPVHEPGEVGGKGVTEAEFGLVNNWANATESVSATLFGRVVRGIGPFGLNNEALAKLLETLLGVTLRKATERLAWCYYDCVHVEGSDEPLSIAGGEPITVRLRVDAEAPRLLGR